MTGRGGARTGAGRMVRRIQLDATTARQLRRLKKSVQDQRVTEQQIVAALIREASQSLILIQLPDGSTIGLGSIYRIDDDA